MIDSFEHALGRHRETFETVAELSESSVVLAQAVLECLRGGGKVLWMGNGGSAADCQHLATEFMVRYKAERGPLPSIALTTDTSLLTSHINDYSAATLFSRQVQALSRPGDLVIGISTSGNSENVLRGIEQAQQMGVKTAALLGRDGGKLRGVADISVTVDSHETARIQEVHIFIGHWLCEVIDGEFASS